MAGHTEELFNEIYDRTNKRILIYITDKCCKTEDIADIFQETYMELFMFLQRKDWSKINSEEAAEQNICYIPMNWTVKSNDGTKYISAAFDQFIDVDNIVFVVINGHECLTD